jgi:hypothetical protein
LIPTIGSLACTISALNFNGALVTPSLTLVEVAPEGINFAFPNLEITQAQSGAVIMAQQTLDIQAAGGSVLVYPLLDGIGQTTPVLNFDEGFIVTRSGSYNENISVKATAQPSLTIFIEGA